MIVVLKKRKNKPGGSRLVRTCWCKEDPSTCPLHQLGPWLASKRVGESLFPGVTAGRALITLRSMLATLGVPGAMEYRTHDLRRGHAKDLQISGASLWTILRAGEWRSPAFLTYLDLHLYMHAFLRVGLFRCHASRMAGWSRIW